MKQALLYGSQENVSIWLITHAIRTRERLRWCAILELMANSSISSTMNRASEKGGKEKEKKVTHCIEVDRHVFSRKRVQKLGTLALWEKMGGEFWVI
jgi:hypothetical protein